MITRRVRSIAARTLHRCRSQRHLSGLAAEPGRGLIEHHVEGSHGIVGKPVGGFAMNMYVLYCEKTSTAAFVDTGATSQEELAPFVDFAAENNLTVTHLLQTHAHIDHIAGLGMAKLIYPDAIVALHVDDTLLYNTAFAQSTFFGVPCPETLPSIDVDLAEGDVLDIGELKLRVLHTPGHCAGHVCLLEEKHALCFGGDLIFQGSIGRTDLPGSNPSHMSVSLARVMKELDDHIQIFPGHMGATSVGTERRSNDVMRDMIEST